MSGSENGGRRMSSRISKKSKKYSKNITSIQANSLKRLQRELMYNKRNPSPYCSVGLKNEDLYEWQAMIEGPPSSVYEGGVFALDISVPPNYPFDPPLVKFRTKIYHCNITKEGKICLDILRKKWTPILTISNVVLSIYSLLVNCNPEDPLVWMIAQEYKYNREKHDMTARKWTRDYAG